jgi:transmembrane sensor
MSHVEDKTLPLEEQADARLEQATEWFLRVRSESARVEDLPELKRWMESDSRNALAYQQVSASWQTVGAHATAPEIMVGRRDAMEHARRAARQRWSTRHRLPRRTAFAASILLALTGGLTWFYFQQGVYATDLGERRTLTLEDGSVVTLDARSRIRVDYQQNERFIALEQGQARFDVAKDPARRFRVRARDQTVIALGTQFNVEIVAGNVLVTMIEGHVAVTGVEPPDPRSKPGEGENGVQSETSSEKVAAKPTGETPRKREQGTVGRVPVIELRSGEGLRVRADGQAVVLPKIDLDRATAWQSGRMFFDNEPLDSAAERVNRYSRLQIEVDPSVANVGVSGVFNAGDATAFIEAVAAYFPVQVNRMGASGIHLTARN